MIATIPSRSGSPSLSPNQAAAIQGAMDAVKQLMLQALVSDQNIRSISLRIPVNESRKPGGDKSFGRTRKVIEVE